MEPKILN